MKLKNVSQSTAIVISGGLISLSILLHGLILKGENLIPLPSTTQANNDTQNQNTGDVAGAKKPRTNVNVSEDNDPTFGNKDAKVAIIEFSDFQCPFCKRFFEDSYSQIKKDYLDTGKARLVYRDFPLSFHPNAEIAAEAAECANEQGKFWEMHDNLFSKQDDWVSLANEDAKKKFSEYAGTIGVDVNQFNNCQSTQKYKDEIQKDIADGTKAGVSGTPTLFINGTEVVGAQPYDTFKSAIENALSAAK